MSLFSLHASLPILAAVYAHGTVIAAVADVAQVHELGLGPGQQFPDDGLGLPPVRGEYPADDPALPVIGPDDLLAMGELRRVFVRRQVAVAAFRMDEDRPPLDVGACRARRCVGDQQQPLTRTRLAQAAPQRLSAVLVDLHVQRVSGFIPSRGPDRVKLVGRNGLIEKPARPARLGGLIGLYRLRHAPSMPDRKRVGYGKSDIMVAAEPCPRPWDRRDNGTPVTQRKAARSMDGCRSAERLSCVETEQRQDKTLGCERQPRQVNLGNATFRWESQ